MTNTSIDCEDYGLAKSENPLTWLALSVPNGGEAGTITNR